MTVREYRERLASLKRAIHTAQDERVKGKLVKDWRGLVDELEALLKRAKKDP